MSTDDAKSYLVSRSIPQLFESLMTGLMYYRPEDHVTYLQDCLTKLQEEGYDSVTWKRFIDQRAKTPLPPIASAKTKTNGYVQGNRSDRVKSPKTFDEARRTPLPPITPVPDLSTGGDVVSQLERIQLPNCPVVLVLGGPGSGKGTQCSRLADRYLGWEHVPVGQILRNNLVQTTSNKWQLVSRLIDSGDLAPEDATLDVLKSTLENLKRPRGILVEGYPRTLSQVQVFEQSVGRVDLVLLIDCEENILRRRLLSRGVEQSRADDNTLAIEKRMIIFKNETLPVVKHFDDKGLLEVIDGDAEADDVFCRLATVFDDKFFSGSTSGPSPIPRPPSASKPQTSRPGTGRYSRIGSGFRNVPRQIEIGVPDQGRKQGQVQCPIFFVVGGPGSGYQRVSDQITRSFDSFEHLSTSELLRMNSEMPDLVGNWQAIRANMADGQLVPDDLTTEVLFDFLQIINNDAKGIVISGFPRTQKQLELFNQKVGGLTLAFVLDCDEDFMKQQSRLDEDKDKNQEEKKQDKAEDRDGEDKDAIIGKRVSIYKHQTLPVLGHLDDNGKLIVINADKGADESAREICALLKERFDLEKGVDLHLPDVPEFPIESENPEDEPAAEDSERAEGLPNCPIIAFVGSSASDYCYKLTNKYSNMALISSPPDDDMMELMQELKNVGSFATSAIISENFPANGKQLINFNLMIGGLNLLIYITNDEDDDDEQMNSDDDDNNADDADNNSIRPVLTHYSKLKKLKKIDGTRSEDEVFEDICKAVNEMMIDTPPMIARSRSMFEDAQSSISPLEVKVPDTGRRDDLPACPIVVIIGGPLSGVEKVAAELAESFSALHIRGKGLSTKEIKSAILENVDESTTCVVLENYPTNSSDLEEFNESIGGMNGVIVWDTAEEFCRNEGANQEVIDEYKQNTLPVLSYYDNENRLSLVSAEEETAPDDARTAFSSYLQSQSEVSDY